jgi:hypothetical protein
MQTGAKAQFDHFITFTGAPDIDEYLEEYRQAGFTVAERTVRHVMGLRNGFINLGLEYLELTWIEEEEEFTRDAPSGPFKDASLLREGARPFAIALASDDVEALHREWSERGVSVPEVTHGVPRDAPEGTQPVWSFLFLPSEITQGAQAFVLTYHMREKGAVRKVTVAPNSVYGVEGVTFTSDEAESRAAAWRDLLAPGDEVRRVGGGHGPCEFTFGPHFARWISPEDYQEAYGLSFKAAPHSYGEIAVLHLLAESLDVAEEKIGAARQVARIVDAISGDDLLLVPPDPRDGFTFTLRERPATDWLQWRTGLTGEKLELG